MVARGDVAALAADTDTGPPVIDRRCAGVLHDPGVLFGQVDDAAPPASEGTTDGSRH